MMSITLESVPPKVESVLQKATYPKVKIWNYVFPPPTPSKDYTSLMWASVQAFRLLPT